MQAICSATMYQCSCCSVQQPMVRMCARPDLDYMSLVYTDCRALGWDQVMCSHLPWESGAGALKPELVLAADVVYDVEVLPVLLRLLRGLLRGGHGQALLATRIRNEATLQEFLRQVPEHELTVCEWVHEAWDSVQFAHLAALDQCRNSIVFHLIKPLLS